MFRCRVPFPSFLVVCALGCGGPSDQSAESELPVITPIDGILPIDDEALQVVERAVGGRLPDDYRRFLLAHNGGFPSLDCVRFEEAERETTSDVFCFLTVGDDQAWGSLEWHLESYAGRLPEGTLPVARDSCGNLWLLSVGGDEAGAVFFWDHGSYDTFDETDLANWPRVATSFTAFLESLGTCDPSTEEGDVPSRYALTRQAIDGMRQRDAEFSARANPGFVWHCDCDDDGNVTMQFVPYRVHAITHTDGYSLMRAIKGVIEEGPTRLPQ